MKKQRILSALLAALLLAFVLQPAVFAAQEDALLHGQPLRVVTSENGFAHHLETADGARYAAAYPTGTGTRKKVQEVFPSSYDSRALGLVTSVKDQNLSGICWAFSVISCLETNAIKQGLADPATVDYSESHLAWFSINSATTDKNDPTYGDGERAGFNTIYQTGGNSSYAIASIARGSGLAKESDFNFLNDFLGLKTYSEKDRYVSELHMRESNLLDCFENEDRAVLIADIKRAVMEYGSVSASYYSSAGNDLYVNTEVNGVQTTAYYQNKTADPDDAHHMVTIVGWDDHFPASKFNAKKRPASDGAWIVKNSWGVGGVGLVTLPDGYMYLSYEDPSLCEIVTYEAMEKDAYDQMYQYDGYYYDASFPMEPHERAAYANVFTAAQDGFLSKVGFYTAEGDQKVDVAVYHNLADLNDPESGDPVCCVSGAYPYEGYHTLDLDVLVALKAGDTFSVVVYAANGSALDVPVEANYFGSNYYSAKDGQSFIHYEDGGRGTWYAASEFSNHSILNGMTFTVCNVPIKGMALSPERHTHAWSEEIYTLAPSCVRDGGEVRVCEGCDAYDYVTRNAAKGHADGNKDGFCDNCGAAMNAGNRCPYCHAIHGTSFFEKVKAFFHRILYYFRQLFRL